MISTSAAHGQALTLDVLLDDEPRRISRRARPDEPLVYQFSSGSTGRPKRVARHPRPVRGARPDVLRGLGLTPEDRIFSTIPLFHTYGMGCCMFGSAASGATIVILEDPHPFLLRRQRALELLERERPRSSRACPSTSA